LASFRKTLAKLCGVRRVAEELAARAGRFGPNRGGA